MKGILIQMKMVQKSGIYFRVLLIYLLICVNIVSNFIITDAQSNYPSGNFEVNACYRDANKTKQNKTNIWKCLRSWGFSEESTAAIMGNIAGESTYDPSRTEGDRSWETIKSGVWTGIGLCQWSGPFQDGSDNRRNKFWEISEKLGKPWTAMECNLRMLHYELFEGGIGKQWWSNGFSSPEEFKKSKDIDLCCQSFYTGFEMCTSDISKATGAWSRYYSSRPKHAKDAYAEFTGTDYKDFKMDGLDDTLNSSDENKDSKSKSSNSNGWVDNEMDLVGMSKYKKTLKDNQKKVEVPTADDLSIDENYTLNQVREGINNKSKMSSYQRARVVVTFVGLCLVFYSVLMLASLMFDRANVFFEFSLIEIITFGLLSYSNDYLTKHKRGYSGTQRIIITIVVILLVGMLLIAGGVFSLLSYLVYEGISGILNK